mmetsp:Transcript_47706/g.154182  ORF Transcript_47706/g.154182 Transcript_47706/m.154182 type:complete len:265 (+) Transcript_47706:1081-1875(+)
MFVRMETTLLAPLATAEVTAVLSSSPPSEKRTVSEASAGFVRILSDTSNSRRGQQKRLPTQGQRPQQRPGKTTAGIPNASPPCRSWSQAKVRRARRVAVRDKVRREHEVLVLDADGGEVRLAPEDPPAADVVLEPHAAAPGAAADHPHPHGRDDDLAVAVLVHRSVLGLDRARGEDKRHDGDSERVAGLCKLVLLVLADPCRAPLEVKGLLDALAQLELVISRQQVRIPRIQVDERSRVGLLPLLACLEGALGHHRVVVFRHLL